MWTKFTSYTCYMLFNFQQRKSNFLPSFSSCRTMSSKRKSPPTKLEGGGVAAGGDSLPCSNSPSMNSENCGSEPDLDSYRSSSPGSEAEAGGKEKLRTSDHSEPESVIKRQRVDDQMPYVSPYATLLASLSQHQSRSPLPAQVPPPYFLPYPLVNSSTSPRRPPSTSPPLKQQQQNNNSRHYNNNNNNSSLGGLSSSLSSLNSLNNSINSDKLSPLHLVNHQFDRHSSGTPSPSPRKDEQNNNNNGGNSSSLNLSLSNNNNNNNAPKRKMDDVLRRLESKMKGSTIREGHKRQR